MLFSWSSDLLLSARKYLPEKANARSAFKLLDNKCSSNDITIKSKVWTSDKMTSGGKLWFYNALRRNAFSDQAGLQIVQSDLNAPSVQSYLDLHCLLRPICPNT